MSQIGSGGANSGPVRSVGAMELAKAPRRRHLFSASEGRLSVAVGEKKMKKCNADICKFAA